MDQAPSISAALWALVLGVLPSVAPAATEPAVAIPILDSTPVLDGRLDDNAWTAAFETPKFVGVRGEDVEPETRAWLGRDASGFWFAIRCEEPRVDAIRAEEVRRNGRVWLDDAIELFLDLNFDQKTYLHLVVNTRGVAFAHKAAIPPDPDAVGPWDPWFEFASSTGEGVWEAEIFLPFASLPPTEQGGDVIGLNICRDRMAGGVEQLSALVPTYDSYHAPGLFARVDGVALPKRTPIDWPQITASRDARDVLLEVDADSLSPLGLAWRVAIEDAAGRTLEQRPWDAASPRLERVAPGARSVRLLGYRGNAQLAAISDAVLIGSGEGVTLRVFQPYIDIEKSLPVTVSLSPASRTVREAKWRIVSNDGDECATGRVPAARLAAWDLPVEDLSPGAYTVELQVVDADGSETIGRTAFTKLPIPPRMPRVEHDEAGILRIDGEPVLPVGIYRMTPNLWETWLKDTGFNVVQEFKLGAGPFERPEKGPIVWKNSLDDIERWLDEADRVGIKVLFDLGVYVKQVFEVEVGEEDGRRLRELVSRFRRHPAILGYYLIDEPYAQHYERVKRAYAIVRQIDPNHPQIAPSLGRSFYYKPTAELVDALMISEYPVPYRPVDTVGQTLDTGRRLIGPTKPLWFVPQATGLRKTLPTEVELRNMTYQALARRVSGLVYFAWFGDRPHGTGELGVHEPEFWRALTELTNELQENRQIHFAPDDSAATMSLATGIDAAARRDEQARYVLIVNTQERPARVKISAKEALALQGWQVRVGEATLESSGDGLAANMQPLGVVILEAPAGDDAYQLKAEFTAPPVPDERNQVRNPGFEDGGAGWTFEGDARRVAADAKEGKACVAMTGRTRRSAVLSDPIPVKPQQKVLCDFKVRVTGPAAGVTIDAKVLVLDAAGNQLTQLSLVGPDEKHATDVAWQWMGRMLQMPDGAASMRVSLGTAHNPGTTSYDAVRVIRDADLARAEPTQ